MTDGRTAALRTVIATRYVEPLREGSSVPALVEADDDGLYVVKLRGAAQGPKALIAELVVGEMGRALGLPVPEIVLVELDPALGRNEPDWEIKELLERSPGLNLGLDFLPGALPFRPGVGPPPDASFAADTVWFDAFATNPDRTARNVNLLVWHRQPWLIDHGAALYIHHTWRDPDAHARRGFERVRDHVLLPYAGSLHDADARLTPRLAPEVIGRIVALIPDVWLEADRDGDEQRRAYERYLLRRLESPRPFLDDMEAAGHAA